MANDSDSPQLDRANRALRGGGRSTAWIWAGGSALVALLLIVALWNLRPQRPELLLYCAAGMTKPAEEIARQYEAENGVRVSVDPAGSGELLTRITAAPDRGDLFLAADNSYIEKGVAKHLLAETFPVVKFHPVIVVQKGNPKSVQSIDDLLRPDVKVALANPELASIGRVVKQALLQTGLWEKIDAQVRDQAAKVSYLNTVNEVALAVDIGAADAGIVWDSNAMQDAKLDAIESPALKDRIETATLAIIAKTQQSSEAQRFARYLTASDKGEATFAKYHYKTVDGAAGAK